MGGVCGGADALALIATGATLIAVATENYRGRFNGAFGSRGSRK